MSSASAVTDAEHTSNSTTNPGVCVKSLCNHVPRNKQIKILSRLLWLLSEQKVNKCKTRPSTLPFFSNNSTYIMFPTYSRLLILTSEISIDSDCNFSFADKFSVFSPSWSFSILTIRNILFSMPDIPVTTCLLEEVVPRQKRSYFDDEKMMKCTLRQWKAAVLFFASQWETEVHNSGFAL